MLDPTSEVPLPTAPMEEILVEPKSSQATLSHQDISVSADAPQQPFLDDEATQHNRQLLQQMRVADPTFHPYGRNLRAVMQSMEKLSIAFDEKAVNSLLIAQSHARDDAMALGTMLPNFDTDITRSGSSLLVLRNCVRIYPETYTAALAATLARSDPLFFPPNLAQRLSEGAKKDGVQFVEEQLNEMIQLVLSEHNIRPGGKGEVAECVIRWLRRQGVRVGQVPYNLALGALFVEGSAVNFPGDGAKRLLREMDKDKIPLAEEVLSQTAQKCLASVANKDVGEKIIEWMRKQGLQIAPDLAEKSTGLSSEVFKHL